MRTLLLAAAVFGFGLVPAIRAGGGEPATVAFRGGDDRVEVVIGQQPVAEYLTQDATITRPYFAHLRTLSGLQVTRNHPPQEGDLQDHATFHPGLWMAFGDLSGSDNWRLQAKVLHERFVEPPHAGAGRGGFTVENRYLNASGEATICREVRRLDFHILPAGWLLIWDSTFASDAGEFWFGDQEEMGLGVRVATPLAVVSNRGGRILDAEGRRNERQVRGQTGPWCDYGGVLEGRQVGVTLLSHPANFRPSWHHVRDYGLAVANPFGRNALTGGPISRVTVKPGETLRLRFGVFVRETATADDFRPQDLLATFVALADRKSE